jgi:hypothetical protein
MIRRQHGERRLVVDLQTTALAHSRPGTCVAAASSCAVKATECSTTEKFTPCCSR